MHSTQQVGLAGPGLGGAGSLRVSGGSVAVTRLYDLAYEIDLERIESEFAASATRLRLTRAKPKAVSYARPPVDIAQPLPLASHRRPGVAAGDRTLPEARGGRHLAGRDDGRQVLRPVRG